jgi:flagellar protein FlgJ
MKPVDALPLLPPDTAATATDRRGQRDRESLRRSCQDFEAIFIQSMFKSMRKSIPDGGLFEKDTAHEIYQDMLDGEVAKEISRHQSLGLADQMYRQMERLLDPHQKK